MLAMTCPSTTMSIIDGSKLATEASTVTVPRACVMSGGLTSVSVSGRWHVPARQSEPAGHWSLDVQLFAEPLEHPPSDTARSSAADHANAAPVNARSAMPPPCPECVRQASIRGHTWPPHKEGLGGRSELTMSAGAALRSSRLLYSRRFDDHLPEVPPRHRAERQLLRLLRHGHRRGAAAGRVARPLHRADVQGDVLRRDAHRRRRDGRRVPGPPRHARRPLRAEDPEEGAPPRPGDPAPFPPPHPPP